MNNQNLLESFKFEYSTDFLIPENNSFIAGREISAFPDYCFVIKYNRFPSKFYMDYKIEDVGEILSILKKNNFKIMSRTNIIIRNGTSGIIFVNNDKKVIVDFGNSFMNTRQNIPSSHDEPEDSYIPQTKKESLSIYYDVSDETIREEFFESLLKFSFVEVLEDKGKILIFEKNEYNDIVLNPYPVKGYNLDISKNYNDDFKEVDEKIRHWVTDFGTKNNKLVLFNGPPGTGKTNYLKYLLNNTPDVKKIYIPPYFVQSLSDPAFFPAIKKEKESLLIIEDGEKILVNREDQADDSTISIILNLCDGILADILNFKIIVTFNTDESRIDDALKRKGRMFAHYKFDKLANKKAKALYKDVYGLELETREDMTLADIYNDTANSFSKKVEKPKIGFTV